MSPVFERPFHPLALTATTFTAVPLQEIAQQLMTEHAFQTTGHQALTVIHHQDLTVVLTVLQAGAVLPAHHVSAPVILLPLWGELLLSSAAGATHLTLDPHHAAVFAAYLTHRVEAQQDSAFVLVMGGQT